jgi:hypothetical protein
MTDTPLDLIPDDKWEQARLRAEVLRGISGRGHDRAQQIVRAAEQLQLTTRTIRRLLSRLQESELRTSSLCRQRPLGGGGISRLHPLVEEIINRATENAISHNVYYVILRSIRLAKLGLELLKLHTYQRLALTFVEVVTG